MNVAQLGHQEIENEKKSVEKKEIHFNFLEIATAVPLSSSASVSQAMYTHMSKTFYASC